MKRSQWKGRLVGGPSDPVLRSWLTEPGSLTARCQRASAHFCVRLVRFGKGKSLVDEADRPLSCIREVVLTCDGQPVIFAHTTLSTVERGKMSRWMARLGTRSLGSLLFSHPGFRRGALEYLRIDPKHPLYRRAASVCPLSGPLWARRSLHRLDGQAVLVTEVFLPGILALK